MGLRPQIADLAEAATATELGQHDHFLGGVHRPVERRFEHVGRRKAEFQIDAVPRPHQLAAIEVAGICSAASHDRHRTLRVMPPSDSRRCWRPASDRSDGHRRNDGQMAYGLYFARQKRHGGSRRDDDRIVLRDQAGGLGADGPLPRRSFSFSLMAVADIGTDQNHTAVSSVQFFCCSDIGEVLR